MHTNDRILFGYLNQVKRPDEHCCDELHQRDEQYGKQVGKFVVIEHRVLHHHIRLFDLGVESQVQYKRGEEAGVHHLPAFSERELRAQIVE